MPDNGNTVWRCHMVINGVIQRKLAQLDDQVLHLEQAFRDISLDDFRTDWLRRSAAERALQVAAEILIDVAERLLALQNAGPAATAAEAVRKLVLLGILRSEQPYIDIVRCRIVIVHQYADVDPSIVHQVVTRRLGDFRSFRNEIDAFLAASDR
jgi:uncharacterized protein YutE (UPF0331/DUF86 family)